MTPIIFKVSLFLAKIVHFFLTLLSDFAMTELSNVFIRIFALLSYFFPNKFELIISEPSVKVKIMWEGYKILKKSKKRSFSHSVAFSQYLNFMNRY